MSILNFKLNGNRYVDSYNNSYYKGNNCFSYSNGDLKFALSIIGRVSDVDFTNFYKCILHCSDRRASGKKIYNNIVVGIDLEEMKNSSKYTKFVFEHIFNESNINNLSKSNYIGSAFIQDDSFIFVRNDEAYKKYYTSGYLKRLALIADLCSIRNQLKTVNNPLGKSPFTKKNKR